jgi:Protein of unknown function (DUF4233)
VTGKLVRQLCGTVLIMEAVIIALAIAPAIALEHLHGGVAGGVGGGLAVCALVLGGLVGRRLWAFWAGCVLQALVIAAGSVVPAMYVLGVVFSALWITGIWLARRLQSASPPASTPASSPASPTSSATSGTSATPNAPTA